MIVASAVASFALLVAVAWFAGFVAPVLIAARRFRPRFEAFSGRLFGLAYGTDREAFDDVHARVDPDGTYVLWVYLRGGGWFFLARRGRRWSFHAYGIPDLGDADFPPSGTRCRAEWFVSRCERLSRFLESWPRAWLRSERVRAVIEGRGDPLSRLHAV